MEPIRYQTRVLAYFDVIGWKNAPPGKALATVQLLDELANSYQKDKSLQHYISEGERQRSVARISVFSDNVAFSMPVSEIGFFLARTATICRLLLSRGLLSRGGIVVGSVAHDANVVVGEALIRAVGIEQSTGHPRLVCDPETVSLVGSATLNLTRYPIVRDQENEHVLNIFAMQPPLIDYPNLAEREAYVAMQIDRCREAVRDGLDAAHVDKRAVAKWRYMKEALEIMLK